MPCSSRAALLLAALVAEPCLADGGPFLEVDPSTVLAAHEAALQQWPSCNHGHSDESFNQLQSVTGLDFGVSARFQVALNLEYDWQRSGARASLRKPSRRFR